MASNILFIASLSALHLPAGRLQSSHPSHPISCTNCSAFHLKVAARLPYLNRSAGKIGVNRILSTTTYNLLTFNISEISSNNSEELSLLPDKHFWTFLLHSSSLFKFPNVESHGRRITFALFSLQKKLSLAPGQSLPAILLSPNSFDS